MQQVLGHEERNQVSARPGSTPLAGASILAWSMLIVVVVGFAPTFLLREVLGRPPLPAYLVVHGTTLTAWYAVLGLQTMLLVRNRYGWHKKLGWGATFVGAAAFLSGIYSVSVLTNRFAQSAAPSMQEVAEFNFLVAASYGAILPFSLFLMLALAYRKQRVLHGRFMLLASVSLIGPAISRIAAWFGELPNPASALILTLPLALLARDFLTERRVHAVTVWGVLSIFAVTFFLNAVKLGDLLARLCG